MPAQNPQNRRRIVVSVILVSLVITVWVLLFIFNVIFPSHVTASMSCKGVQLNYTCTHDFGCGFTYEGYEELHDTDVAKTHLCLTECQRACSEDGGHPDCFASCCDCLYGMYYALAPRVQPAA